jgi:transposase InsO family protein
VGSASGRDFPSAFVRFRLGLGIQPHICPPHRPDTNAFVERLHRTYKEEWRLVHRPGALEQVREVTEVFMAHYNTERPLKAALLWQCPAARRLPHLAHAACGACPGRS